MTIYYWTPTTRRPPDATAQARYSRLMDATRLRIWLHCHPDDHVRQAMEPIAVAGDLALYAIREGTPADAADAARRAWDRARRLVCYMDAARLPLAPPLGAYRPGDLPNE
jgi:hypothetical protein